MKRLSIYKWRINCALFILTISLINPWFSNASTDVTHEGAPEYCESEDCHSHSLFHGRIPKDHLSFLNDLLDWIENTPPSKEQQKEVTKFWDELKSREKKLHDYIEEHRSITTPDLDEHAQSLFVLHHISPEITRKLKERLLMPHTTIDVKKYKHALGVRSGQVNLYAPEDLEAFSLHNMPVEGMLDKEGNLYNPAKYSQLDPGWSSALAYYIGYKTGFIGKAPMNPPAFLNLSDQDDLSIVVIGDWGTGYWSDGTDPSPAQLVMTSMQQHQATIAIHLGDEYYAGTQYTLTRHPGEEAFNFASLWDVPANYSFALGSNHGMYDGENGLRYVTLQSKKFSPQKQSTTFAIELKHWIIVGLDTARNDPSTLFQKGYLDPVQGDFLKQMGKKGKRILLFTHHTGISFDGKTVNEPLWPQVLDSLGRQPHYWIWGHIHQGINYSNISAAGATVSRCWGHGAIPVGKSSLLMQSDGSCCTPEVSYYSHTPYPNPDREQKHRIRNGYGLIRFNGEDSVIEQLYDQYGELQQEELLYFTE